jgi:hypothetical protein
MLFRRISSDSASGTDRPRPFWAIGQVATTHSSKKILRHNVKLVAPRAQSFDRPAGRFVLRMQRLQ